MRFAPIRRAILGVAFSRSAALIFGGLLTAGALVPMIGDYAWETWWTDGLSLVAGATGLALIIIGATGRSPDWIE